MKKIYLLLPMLALTMGAMAQTSAPEGEVTYYQRSGGLYNNDWDGLVMGSQVGAVGVVMNGNDVYFENLVSSYNNDNWVKGTLGEDGKTITIAPGTILLESSQWAEVEGGNWAEFKGYVKLSMLNFVPALAVGETATFVEDAETPITFTMEDGIIKLNDTAAGQRVLGGVYTGFELEGVNGQWSMGADFGTVLTPITEQPVSLPEGLEAETWSASYCSSYNPDYSQTTFTNLYRTGNEVYWQGFASTYPDMCIKGTITDDTMHFDSHQYVGVSQSYMLEVVGSNVTRTPNEWDWFDVSFEDIDGFDLYYDAATQSWSLPEGKCVRLTVVGSPSSSWTVMENLVLTPYQNEILTPANPEILDYANYWDLEGDWDFVVYFPSDSQEGKTLNPDNLYYRIYVNDELYTFDAQRYELEEDLTEIPYTLSGNEYLNHTSYFGVHNYIQEQDIWKLGIQLIYRVGDEERCSDIISCETGEPIGIEQLSAEEQQQMPRYGINGQRVSADYRGIVIENGRKVIK